MKQNNVLMILFCIPFLLVLVLLNQGIFHYDAIVLAQAVEKTYETRTLQPAINGRYGSVILASVIYFPFWVFGQTADLATRLLSAFFYAASIPAAYLFLQSLYKNKLIGIFGALMFAAMPMYLSPNTFGKEHGVALFFVFSSFYFLLVGLQRQETKKVFWAAVLLIISHTVREATLFFVPFSLCITFFTKTGLTKRQRIFASVIPYVLMFFILNVLYFDFIVTKTLFPEQAGTAYFYPRQELRTQAINAIQKTTSFLFPLLAGVGVLAGLFVKKTRFPTFFMTCMLVGSFFLFAHISTFAPRYLDVTLFSISALAATALFFLHERSKMAAWIIVVVICLSSLLFITPLLWARHTMNGQVAVGNWIQENTSSNALIITQDDAPFISYYGKRRMRGPPIKNLTASVLFMQDLENEIKAGIPVYLTVSGLFDDPEEINKNLFHKYFILNMTAKILSEDFHNAEIERQRYYQIIWQLTSRVR